MKNREIANMLYEIADYLEIKGVQFKPRAYRQAAQSVETLSEDIQDVYEREELENIPRVGASIASKIKEILETGHLKYLEDLREERPEGLRELMEIEDIGPKTALKLYKELKISNIDELESAAKEGKIRDLEGFGEKIEENILENIKMYRSFHKRFILGFILPDAQDIVKKLKNLEEVEKISLAGSIRRKKETIGDVDILITSQNPSKVMDFFTKLPEVKRVIAKGKTKSTIVVANNLHVDLRIIEKESFGAALQYFTGSKEHNIKLRKMALDKNWKLSEYGLFKKENDKMIAGENEEEIYKTLEMNYIEPELRENRGEIEAALKDELPRLIEYDEVKGDLHVHSTWSEGVHSIEEMAETARPLGHEYIAICDHAKTLQIAQGLTDEDLRKQIKEIEKINRKMDDFTILSGVEANIDSDGNVDVGNDVLKDLDVVVASVHSGLKQSEKKLTERILTAMHNDHVTVIGHPTGRLINERKPCELDLSKAFEAAAELRVFMEINAFPNRLDLSDANCRKAKEYGVKLSLGSDAHSRDHLRYLELGIATARRGWLEKENIINSLSLKELKKLLGS
ncbi:MAG: DNA polymerase/3'-5' exonuclease PolX [Promethearchaeota archaeon]